MARLSTPSQAGAITSRAGGGSKGRGSRPRGPRPAPRRDRPRLPPPVPHTPPRGAGGRGGVEPAARRGGGGERLGGRGGLPPLLEGRGSPGFGRARIADRGQHGAGPGIEQDHAAPPPQERRLREVGEVQVEAQAEAG